MPDYKPGYEVFPSEFDRTRNRTQLAEKFLGYCGRMIAGSKSGYSKYLPCNTPVFNANVVTAEGKAWHGDLDLTTDEAILVKAAEGMETTLYVLYEMDGRFENADKPKIEQALAIVTKEGLKLTERSAQYWERCKRGRLAGKIVTKKEFRR